MSAAARNILISLGVSLLFHLLLLKATSYVPMAHLPGVSGSVERLPETRLPIELTRVDEAELEKREAERKSADDAAEKARRKRELERSEAEDAAVARIFKEHELTRPQPAPLRFAGVSRRLDLPKRESRPEPPAAMAPRPEIVQIEMAQVPQRDRNDPGRVAVPKVERLDVNELKLPSLLPHGPLSDTETPALEVGLRMGRPRFSLPRNVGDEEVSRGVTGVYKGNSEVLRLTHGPKLPTAGDDEQTVPFDDFVNVRMLVKDDPREGGGYFVISIEANRKSESVQETPKDVLLAIDSSGSISGRQLNLFKEASYSALASLRENDRFNVVTFSNRPQARFQTFVPATEENRRLAVNFIRRLNNLGTTSVFGAIEPFIRSARQDATGRPLNIFLMTDGVSTVNIYNDDEFLRQVSGINPGQVSIFPFSVGEKANRELLDFLGFQNRGASLHAADLQGAKESLAAFIGRHSDLLVRNLEYVSSARTVRDIYPRKVQHLYRDSDVKLYGRFSPGETSVVLELVGYDSQNQRRSMIFQGVFAECRRTEEPLEQIWAGRKILDLVSSRMMAPDEATKKAIDREIRGLSEHYNLAVPY